MNLLECADVQGIVLTLVDRTELHRALDLAEWQARFDSLTGLPNRRTLEEQGRELFSGSHQGPALALLDLDNFKGVNDVYGHQAGDQALRSVADRLVRTVGECGTVARVGGTVFGILLRDVSPSTARALLEEAARSIRMPLEGMDLELTGTCGVVSSTAAKHWPGFLPGPTSHSSKRSSRNAEASTSSEGTSPGWKNAAIRSEAP